MLPRNIYLAGKHKDDANRATEGESNTITNPLLCAYKQVTKKWNFGQKQKHNEQLKHW